MKFGDLAIFAKVGWEILEIRLRYSYLAPVSILFRLQTGAVHENESHCAIHFRGTTPGSDGQAFYCAQCCRGRRFSRLKWIGKRTCPAFSTGFFSLIPLKRKSRVASESTPTRGPPRVILTGRTSVRGTEHPEPFFSRKLRSELSLMYCKFGSLLQPFPVAADFFDLHLELEHNFFIAVQIFVLAV